MDISNIQNYTNLNLLTNGFVSTVLRKVFQEKWSFCGLKEWNNTDEDGQQLITGVGINVYKTAVKIQKRNLKSGDTNKWDLPLLVKIIKEVIKLSSNERNSSINDNLKILVDMRNKLAHSAIPNISNEEYKSDFNAIANAVSVFGVAETELYEYLSGVNCKNVKSTVQKNEKNATRAKKLKADGNQLLKNGDIKGAITKYSEALLLPNIPPEDQAILYSNRSKAFLDLENADTAKALEDADQTINLNPRWSKGYFRVATVYEINGNLQQATKFFNLALALNPNDAEIGQKLTICHFREALNKIDPKYLFRTVHEYMEGFMTHLKQENGDFTLTTEMIEEANQKLKSESSYPGFLIKGILHRSAGKYKLAGEFFQKAIETEKNENAEALYNLAMLIIEKRLGNTPFEEAIHLLTKAAVQNQTNDPGVPMSTFILGLYHQVGTKNLTAAMHGYESALNSPFGGLAAHYLAIMYDEGIGVPQNRNTAVELWNEAAEKGISSAMESLARYYLENYDFQLSLKWYSEAVIHGSKHFSTEDEKFKADISKLEIMNGNLKMAELNITEKGDCFESQQLTIVLKSKMNFLIQEIILNHFQYDTRDKITPSTQTGSNLKLNQEFVSNKTNNPLIPVLQKQAENGNENAKILLQTHKHYTTAVKIFLTENCSNQPFLGQMIGELASAIRLESSFITIDLEIMRKMSAQLKQIISSEMEDKSSLDQDSRVCLCHFGMIMNGNDYDRTLFLAQESSGKYPNEAYFYFMIGSMYGFKEHYETGVKETNKGLELFPRDYHLLYNKAALIRNVNLISPETVIQCYREYIKHAPSGERKIPEAYYVLAIYYMKMMNNENKTPKRAGGTKTTSHKNNFHKYFKLAKESEKSLAPCYLPFESSYKNSAEYIMQFLSTVDK